MFQLNIGSKTVRTGDSVSCSIRVETEVEPLGGSLILKARWYTESKAPEMSGTVFEEQFTTGEIVPGEIFKRDRRIRIPGDGPVTYEGVNFSIGWEIALLKDGSWGHSSGEREDLIVRPS